MKIKSFILPVILLYVSGCSSTVKAPIWYINPPVEKGMRYTTGTATADDLQTSFDMARLVAEQDLARELKAQLNGSMDREITEDEKTTLDRFRSTIETVISADISGASIEKRDYTTKGSMYNAFVLLKYDENKMEKRLLSKLQAEKELYDELKATEMLQEMRNRVDQYKKSGF